MVTAERVQTETVMTDHTVWFGLSVTKTDTVRPPVLASHFPNPLTNKAGGVKEGKSGEARWRPLVGVHRPASRQSTGGWKMVPKSRPTYTGLRTVANAVGSGQAAAVELLTGVVPSTTGSGEEGEGLWRQSECEANTSGGKATVMSAARRLTQVTAVVDGLRLGGLFANEGIDGCRACRRWIPARSR